MIRAIIFDCFGVLTSEGWIPFRDEHFAGKPDKLGKANELMQQLVTGQVSDEAFHEAIAKLAGVTPLVVLENMRTNTPDEALFEYIQGLRPHYKIAMLSNVGRNPLAEIFTPEQIGSFDVLALSSETGHAKPEAAAYQEVAETLGVAPAECVFVDDQPRHAKGAQDVGMQTILYKDFEQFRRDLEKMLNTSS
jgi:HAD superfamily hydrolase (TIGR01509 family)